MSAIHLVALKEVRFQGEVVAKNIHLTIDLDSCVDVMDEIKTLLTYNWFCQKDWFMLGQYIFFGQGNSYKLDDLEIDLCFED